MSATEVAKRRVQVANVVFVVVCVLIYYKHPLAGLPKVQLRVNNLAEHIPDSKLYNILYIHHASFL